MSGAKELADRLASLERRVEELERRHADGSKPRASETKELSVREFLLSKRPSNDVEKTLLIGYFLEKFGGLPYFNIDDLGRYFQLAKEATPANINDKVNMNIKKGHLAEVKERKDNKKAWIVTNSGERSVENDFGKGGS